MKCGITIVISGLILTVVLVFILIPLGIPPFDSSIENTTTITVAERYPGERIIVSPDNERYRVFNTTMFWSMRVGHAYDVETEYFPSRPEWGIIIARIIGEVNVTQT